MSTRRWIAIAAGIGAFAILLAPETLAAQCAMCRRALDSPERQHLVGGLRRGILVLLPSLSCHQ
jgi:hypothetical protein